MCPMATPGDDCIDEISEGQGDEPGRLSDKDQPGRKVFEVHWGLLCSRRNAPLSRAARAEPKRCRTFFWFEKVVIPGTAFLQLYQFVAKNNLSSRRDFDWQDERLTPRSGSAASPAKSAGCRTPSRFQWRCCADGLWRAVCPKHDVQLNSIWSACSSAARAMPIACSSGTLNT